MNERVHEEEKTERKVPSYQEGVRVVEGQVPPKGGLVSGLESSYVDTGRYDEWTLYSLR